MRNRALIVIEIQNDYFPGGGWPLVGVEESQRSTGDTWALRRAPPEFRSLRGK